MSNYGLNANVIGKLVKPCHQWFWWYNAAAPGPSFTFEGIVPFNLWSLSTGATTGSNVAAATSVLSSVDGTPAGGSIITFPVKGKYTISFSVPIGSGATNNMAWWTVNTGYDAVNNTSLIRNNLGWASPPNTIAASVTFSGIFNAGDKVYPVVYSSTATNLDANTDKRFSLSVVLDYQCS